MLFTLLSIMSNRTASLTSYISSMLQGYFLSSYFNKCSYLSYYFLVLDIQINVIFSCFDSCSIQCFPGQFRNFTKFLQFIKDIINFNISREEKSNVIADIINLRNWYSFTARYNLIINFNSGGANKSFIQLILMKESYFYIASCSYIYLGNLVR